MRATLEDGRKAIPLAQKLFVLFPCSIDVDRGTNLRSANSDDSFISCALNPQHFLQNSSVLAAAKLLNRFNNCNWIIRKM